MFGRGTVKLGSTHRGLSWAKHRMNDYILYLFLTALKFPTQPKGCVNRSCFCLLRADTKGVCPHTWLSYILYISSPSISALVPVSNYTGSEAEPAEGQGPPSSQVSQTPSVFTFLPSRELQNYFFSNSLSSLRLPNITDSLFIKAQCSGGH